MQVSQTDVTEPGQVLERIKELKSEGRRTVMLLVSGADDKLRFVSLRFEEAPKASRDCRDPLRRWDRDDARPFRSPVRMGPSACQPNRDDKRRDLLTSPRATNSSRRIPAGTAARSGRHDRSWRPLSLLSVGLA